VRAARNIQLQNMTPIQHAEPAAPTQASGGGSFEALGLSPEICERVRAAGYTTPTPIQCQAIPRVLGGRDLLGSAQTGTGKTAAFALPILEALRAAGPPLGLRPIRALVLAPTRELAAQIGASFLRYAPRGSLRCHVVFGGVGKGPQVHALRRGIDVLVATPGRLLDLMNDGEVDLRQVDTFVLDEADRMLDMGFVQDVRRIARALPKRRQTLLFSATMPRAIRALANQLLGDPIELAVDPVSSTVEPLDQYVYFVDAGRKIDLLVGLLTGGDVDRALVFTRTKHGANRVVQQLNRARIGADAIHGNKSQSARERALDAFKRGRTRVVVATDLASRGIDVKDLPHVINFDMPNEPEVYVHRVGRTGRAGASGTALSLCAPSERGFLASIERLTKRRIERREVSAELAARVGAARALARDATTQHDRDRAGTQARPRAAARGQARGDAAASQPRGRGRRRSARAAGHTASGRPGGAHDSGGPRRGGHPRGAPRSR
jgi:ATP-dependent RNA helicase RhlE